MELLYPHGAFLDVHKATVEACVRHLEQGRARQESRRFGTTTAELWALRQWLLDQGVTQVGMEATGVYWQPVWNILEEGLSLLLANPAHMKHLPGRKSDVRDAQWGAELLQFGLLKPSLVLPRPMRQARELTRQYSQLTAEHTRVVNRLHKVLQDANLKLSSVMSDVLGVSGRDMLQALIAGENDPAKLADLARRQWRGKIPQLRQALAGKVTDHHRFMLELLWDHLQHLEGLLGRLAQRLDEALRPFEDAVRHLDTVHGVDRRVAQSLIAETGGDMSKFPSAGHLASWGSMCPGQHESAGRRKGGRTRPGNRWLRATLVQAAWGASHKKDSYLAAQFRRLARHRGRRRALIAVGHSILVIVYHLLKDGTDYQDLGGDYFDRHHAPHLQKQLVRRLERLGYQVTLAPVP
jgi:transposase